MSLGLKAASRPSSTRSLKLRLGLIDGVRGLGILDGEFAARGAGAGLDSAHVTRFGVTASVAASVAGPGDSEGVDNTGVGCNDVAAEAGVFGDTADSGVACNDVVAVPDVLGDTADFQCFGVPACFFFREFKAFAIAPAGAVCDMMQFGDGVFSGAASLSCSIG
jgi:hypothetical protein